MKVLLFSRNHTVTDMVALAVDGIGGVEFHVAEDLELATLDRFDWVLVNDTFPMYQESLALAKKLGDPQTVILYQPGNTLLDGFDHQIQKPFLPSDIQDLIDIHTPSMEAESKKRKKKKKHKKIKQKVALEPQVLNLDEIETIKALLEEDGLEIVHEEELTETVLSDSKPKIKPKKYEKKLLKALKTMKPKKIRKLLRSAHITLHIAFPGDDR